jgi:hypothetical protein
MSLIKKWVIHLAKGHIQAEVSDPGSNVVYVQCSCGEKLPR